MRRPLLCTCFAALFAAVTVTACSSEPQKADPAKKGAPEDPTKKSSSAPAENPAENPVKKDEQPSPGTASVAMPDKTPATFQVKFETTCGDFVVEAHRDWAPLGVDRFFELVKKDFFKDIAFFRVIPNFMVQFGIHGDPEQAGEWRGQQIQDDPAKQSNTRGMLTYAMAGPNTRTTQMFVNFKDNSFLDNQGFSPFAKVIEGMDTVDKIYKVGEGAPRGPGPAQGRLQGEGNKYLKEAYPKLDYIKRAVYLSPAK